MRPELINQLTLSREEQHKNFLFECYSFAAGSEHPSTHNAALLVDDDRIVLKGRNDFPPGVKASPERVQGPNKHLFLNHAERDVLYKAAKLGHATIGLTMVMPWLPCIPCANAIVSAGISQLLTHKQMIERTKESWQSELEQAAQLLREANVSIVTFDGEIGVEAYMHRTKWLA